jgi:hypothetical protein
MIKMVNEINSDIKMGKGVFNKSVCWVFETAEKGFQWDIFLTDLKFVLKSPEYLSTTPAQLTLNIVVNQQ